ncbi:MAG: hypothetical protein VW907_03845 [Opitutae bacterium]
MESNASEGISPAMEQKFRELNLEKANQHPAEVPKTGNESSVKVTKSEEDLDLGGSLKDQQKPLSMDENCGKPGEPPPSVDIVDDTGIDCTREPDWQVVKSDHLPEKPEPTQVHNDKYWDERSIDRELQSKDLQDEMIRREMEDFDRAARAGDDPGRSFQNEVLDPYYGGGNPPSEPPGSNNSLDSFI